MGLLLKSFAIMAPMLYTDAVVDAAVKGMGQQVACVRYNTLTSFLDVVFLWVLLPKLGLRGYYLSFAATHLLNFCLSVRRLGKVTGCALPVGTFWKATASAVAGILLCSFFPKGEGLWSVLALSVAFLAAFLCLLILTGCLGKEDLRWLQGLVRGRLTEGV